MHGVAHHTRHKTEDRANEQRKCSRWLELCCNGTWQRQYSKVTCTSCSGAQAQARTGRCSAPCIKNCIHHSLRHPANQQAQLLQQQQQYRRSCIRRRISCWSWSAVHRLKQLNSKLHTSLSNDIMQATKPSARKRNQAIVAACAQSIQWHGIIAVREISQVLKTTAEEYSYLDMFTFVILLIIE